MAHEMPGEICLRLQCEAELVGDNRLRGSEKRRQRQTSAGRDASDQSRAEVGPIGDSADEVFKFDEQSNRVFCDQYGSQKHE